jgi:hypothetical protein
MSNDDILNSPFGPEEMNEGQLDQIQNDRRMARIVRSFMKKSKDYREDFLDLATTCRRDYKNWEVEARSKIKRANIQPSYGFMIIETLLPQLVDIFFGDHDVIKFRGRTAEDMQYEDCLTDFFDIQFSNMKLPVKGITFMKNMLLDGTAIAKVPYRFEEQLVKRRQVGTNPDGTTFVEKEAYVQTIFDGPDFDNIDIYDFFPDWRVREAGNIQKMRGCAHRMFRSMSELKRREEKTVDGQKTGIYRNLDELKRSLVLKGEAAWGGCYWEDDHKRSMENLDNKKQNVKDSDGIEIWEFWGLFDLKGNGKLEECIVTVANGDTVIRAVPNLYDNQFKPFIACPNYLRTGEFYGIPELAAVNAEIREARALRNARLDQINIGVNNMWLVDRAGGIDAKNLYSRPGGIVFTNDMNAVKPIEVGDPSASSAQELSYIESNIAQITAIGAPPVIGSTKSFARSATGVDFVAQFATSRLGLKAKLISELMFHDLVHIMMATNQQFVTDAQWVRGSDPNEQNPFKLLPPDAFFSNYEYEFHTKPEESDDNRFQKMQAVSQIIQVAEQTQPGAFKMDVVMEALLRPLLGTGVKRFMRSEQEIQQMQMQQLQMRVQEQAANAQIGAQAPQPNANPKSPGGPVNAV